MRLIDANKLKQDVLDWQDCYNGFSDTYDKAMIIGEIDEQPTIEAEPVRHGKWIKENIVLTSLPPQRRWHCSECGSIRDGYDENVLTPYCSNCGAKMDLKEVEE